MQIEAFSNVFTSVHTSQRQSKGASEPMGASSTKDQQVLAASAMQERGASAAPVTLSERSLLALAIFRIFVGYLWFQQLFWKLPPDFAGLYHFVIRETHFAFIPGYSYLLQHTFLAG